MPNVKRWKRPWWWAGCALVLVACFVVACSEEADNGDIEVVDYLDGNPDAPVPTSFTGERWSDRTNSDCRQYQGLGYGGEARGYILEWGHRGDYLLFDDGDAEFSGTKLLVVDDEGTRVRTVVDANESFLFKHGFHASVSPANGDILYSSCEYPFKPLAESQRIHWVFQQERGTLVEPRSLYHYELAVVGFDGANKRRLTYTGGDLELKPVWSPDGTRFAHEQEKEGLVIAEEGSGTHTVLREPVHRDWLTAGWGGLRWSRDGSRVLFTFGSLHIVDLETNERVRIDAPEGGFVKEGSFSPDGNHMAWAEAGRVDTWCTSGRLMAAARGRLRSFPVRSSKGGT